MPIRHNFRDFTPDNASEDRADWNHIQVQDRHEGFTDLDVEGIVNNVVNDLPEQSEAFGRTSTEVDPGDPPQAFYHMDKSQEEMKNLGRPDGGDGISDRFRERVWDQVDAIKDRGNRVQSNSVKYVDHLMTVSPQYFRPDDPNAAGKFDRDKVEAWLRDSLRTIQENFAEENLAALEVHLDESTPHIHFQTVPETQDGRLSVNDRYTPSVLRGMQTEYAENLPDEIQRGEVDSPAERKTMKEVYHDTAEEVEELRDEIEVKDSEIDTLRTMAEPIRESVEPEYVAENTTISADPDPYDNPIDYLMENSKANFAESVKMITEVLTQDVDQKADTIQDLKSEVKKERELKNEQGARTIELKLQLDEAQEENETLKDTLDEVAEEHGLEVEAGDFHVNYSDMDQAQTPSHDPEPDDGLDMDMTP